jgi:hypothetical protein|tara:strand:+ start:389 stop:511 length:123 start_codon:yes stop_codon:yes gene_type:complete
MPRQFRLALLNLKEKKQNIKSKEKKASKKNINDKMEVVKF